jgi:hypothetical protein
LASRIRRPLERSESTIARASSGPANLFRPGVRPCRYSGLQIESSIAASLVLIVLRIQEFRGNFLKLISRFKLNILNCIFLQKKHFKQITEKGQNPSNPFASSKSKGADQLVID